MEKVLDLEDASFSYIQTSLLEMAKTPFQPFSVIFKGKTLSFHTVREVGAFLTGFDVALGVFYDE